MESHEELLSVIKKGIDREALDALDRFFFPEKSPELNDSIDAIRYASGQRSVIRFLKEVCG